MINSKYLKIRNLNDKGASLLNNKQPIEAKKYIDEAYKLICDIQVENTGLYVTVMFNKIVMEREFKNFSLATILLNNLICKLEDDLPSENLIKAKILSATIKTDMRDFDNSIVEFNECLSAIGFLEQSSEYFKLSNSCYNLKTEAYNNLAMTYSFIGKLSEALEYYNKTLALYEVNKSAKGYKFNKADTLNNIGIVYQKLNLDEEAIQYFNKALKLHDNDYYIAMVYNNLANSYRKFGNYDFALKFREKSINIRKKMYLQGEKYADNYADELNNYGNLLNEIGRYKEAIDNFLKSLKIFENLSKVSPEKYKEKFASTSANIAGSYCYIGKFDKAKYYCNEALKFFRDNYDANPIEYAVQICGVLSNLSIIELYSGNISDSEKYFLEVFKYLSCIKTMLNDCNKPYFYAYKSRIEKILEYLINLYLNDPDKLLMIIENKRKEDFVYNKKYDINPKIKYLNKEVLITIELTYNNCIFLVTSKKGNKVYTVKNDKFISKCNELLTQVYNICYKNKIEDYTHAFLLKLGNDIFNLFPNELKECLCNNDNKIFLSLDQCFMNFPFEFLAHDNVFIGQIQLLPRVSGFDMFLDIIKSHPKIKSQNKKIVIRGDDTKLCGAKSEYKKLLQNDLLKSSLTLSRTDASLINISKILDNSIAIFHFCGHGNEPDKLILNYGKDIIDSNFFEKYYFDNNPLFFINCCLAGTLKYFGGGKYKGLSATLYKRGAKAIISCTYPIFDKQAKSFSINFYEKFSQGNNVGDSILFARSCQQKPWEWGLHYLYGNPYLRINEDCHYAQSPSHS